VRNSAVNAKGGTETAWLASLLLESLHKQDPATAASVHDMVERLESRGEGFDAGTQERVDLLAAVSEAVRTAGGAAPAHVTLLSHLARGLLLQPMHGAS